MNRGFTPTNEKYQPFRINTLCVIFIAGFSICFMINNKTKFYLTVASAIIIFDVVASFASRWLNVDYTMFGLVSLCLYLISGYLGCKFYGFLSGIIAGLITGFTDSTIGWLLSYAIGPCIPFGQPHFTFPLVLIVVVIVILEATILGSFGALLFLIKERYNRVANT
jgi:hypothetical protein